ncbi:MAG: type IX secretion system membrane protein PorP/SprF [Bacteroidota bacterium]
MFRKKPGQEIDRAFRFKATFRKVNRFIIKPIVMKTYLILFGIVCIKSTLFSQLDQQWNYQNVNNPATNGLNYQHEANVAYNFSDSKIANGTYGLASYSTFLEKAKVGLGVNYLQWNYPQYYWQPFRDLQLKFAANRQFQLGKDMVLSAGFGIGMASFSQIKTVFPEIPASPTLRKQSIFTSDIGFAFRWKRLSTNLSVNHFLDNKEPEWTNPKNRSWNGFVSYNFGNREGFEIIPNGSIITERGFTFYQGVLIAQYKSKYLLGVGYNSYERYVGTIGYTFKKRFRVSYSYSKNFTSSISFNPGRHEVNLALVLNKK